MSDFKEQIEIIIKEGIQKNWDADTIVDKILALGAEERKSSNIPIEEYEKILSDSKTRIKEARNALVQSITGSTNK